MIALATCVPTEHLVGRALQGATRVPEERFAPSICRTQNVPPEHNLT